MGYNPFALNTAHTAWTNGGNSTAYRIFYTVQGALNDIFVKNIYNLAVGGIQNAFFSPESRTNLEKVTGTALSLVGCCYALMFYGSNLYLSGKFVVELNNNIAVPCLIKVGNAVKIVGEKVFLAGAVPLYGMCYAFPKKVIQSFPKTVRFIAKKVMDSAQWAFNHVITPLWEHVFRHVFNFIGKRIQTIAKIICEAIEAIVHQIARIATWVFQNILQPLWSHVIAPICSFIGRSIQKVAIMLVTTLRSIVTKVIQSANWVFHHILVPLWRWVIYPIIHGIGSILYKIGVVIAQGLRFVVGKIIQYAAWVFQNVLVPCFNTVEKAAITVGKVLLDYLILPIGRGLYWIAHKIAAFVQIIFYNYLVPSARAIGKGLKALGDKIYEISQIFLEGVGIAWHKTAAFFGVSDS